MNKLRKAYNVITLAASDTREGTIEGIIENVLFDYNEPIQKSELNELIESKYSVKLFSNELISSLEKLIKNGGIVKTSNTLELSKIRRSEIGDCFLKEKSKESSRKINFRASMIRIAQRELLSTETDFLFELYSKYLFEAFYIYGDNAYKYFHPNEESIDINIGEHQELKDLIVNETKDYPELKKIFVEFIEHLEEYLDSDDVNHLFEVSRKSNCFLSIGLSKELQQEIYYDKIIDWVVFVDTNFIYSILDLHQHPEDFSCKQLVHIIKEHDLPIKLRYLPYTWKELLYKKKEWEEIIPRKDYTRNQLQGILESKKIDGVAKKYISSLLINESKALHPSDIIDQTSKILRLNGIEIYNEKFEQIDENYFQTKLDDFSTYLFNLNEARLGRNLSPTHRHHKQVEHDIFLREAILDLRFRNKRKFNSLNEAKYFGLTLDKLLLKYDAFELRKNEFKLKYFTFIKPSFLLNKIVRILPAITSDYKLAYLSALASRNFNYSQNGDTEKAFKTLNYLCEIGIDEKEVIFELISDDLFVNKLNESDLKIEEKYKFVESEIGKKINEQKKEVEEVKSRYEKLEKHTNNLKQDSLNKEEEIESISQLKVNYQEQYQNVLDVQRTLLKELKKVKSELEKNKSINEKDANQQTLKLEFYEETSIEKDKPWYSKIWLKILGVLTVLGLLSDVTGLNGLNIIGKLFNEEQKIEKENTSIEETAVKNSVINVKDSTYIDTTLKK